MAIKNKAVAFLGVITPIALGGAAFDAQAQTGQVTRVKYDWVSSVSLLADKGLVAIKAERWEGGQADPEDSQLVPVVLCPGATNEQDRYTAYVAELPTYRTLIDRLVQRGAGTVETKEAQNGRCYVTSLTF